MDHLGLIKIKNFCSMEALVKRLDRLAMNWEKMFVNAMTKD